MFTKGFAPNIRMTKHKTRNKSPAHYCGRSPDRATSSDRRSPRRSVRVFPSETSRQREQESRLRPCQGLSTVWRGRRITLPAPTPRTWAHRVPGTQCVAGTVLALWIAPCPHGPVILAPVGTADALGRALLISGRIAGTSRCGNWVILAPLGQSWSPGGPPWAAMSAADAPRNGACPAFFCRRSDWLSPRSARTSRRISGP